MRSRVGSNDSVTLRDSVTGCGRITALSLDMSSVMARLYMVITSTDISTKHHQAPAPGSWITISPTSGVTQTRGMMS